jgi:Dehydrogenases with different specificities (related to short-chain alcohol dehydrogenases)
MTLNEDKPLAGKIALVTGAAQGLGAAHARRLADAGALVAVNDLSPSPELTLLAEEIGGVPARAMSATGIRCRNLWPGLRSN